MQKLLQFSGIKTIAVLMIFWMHSSIPSPHVDLGARGCELFFIISGFLYFYNHKENPIPPTFKNSMLYVEKKLVCFLPLHLLTLGIYLVLFPYATVDFSEKLILFFKFLINLFLLQAWSPLSDILYSFNGLVWYISALLFACFMSPLLARLIKNPSKKYIYFPTVFIIRLLFEYIQFQWPNTFFGVVHFHCFPVVRTMEYFMGMMIAGFYFDSQNNPIVSSKKTMSGIEICAVLSYVTLLITKQDTWHRATFVLAGCILIFILSFGSGIVSTFLANRVFQIFSVIQLEFYLFHHIAIRSTSVYLSKLFNTWYTKALISFILCVSLSISYSKIFRKPFEKCTSQSLQKIREWIVG